MFSLTIKKKYIVTLLCFFCNLSSGSNADSEIVKCADFEVGFKEAYKLSSLIQINNGSAYSCIFENKNGDAPRVELFYKYIKFEDESVLSSDNENKLSQLYFSQMNKYEQSPIDSIVDGKKFRCIVEINEDNKEKILSCHAFFKSNIISVRVFTSEISEFSLGSIIEELK